MIRQKYMRHCFYVLLIILYIKIAFLYVNLSGNLCQLSSLNSSEDGVQKSQSKITRAALILIFTSLSSNVEIQLPQIMQQKSR